ncbi:alpha/beta fold hydrolase [Ramlibacter montanisoli]|uniref:alpha/beta fold hydrolase n=1 Tax=Ramlibacter montanisoli TaxID=2732512 RepID=UPI00359F4BF4
MTSTPAFTTLGGGPTVLMLHGIGGGHLAFAPQVETLATAGYRAVAWDMPGYGHSAPIEPYTFKGLAHSCIRLIESLKCQQVILLGHSMGGMVAQEVVARRPDLVKRLVLCGTSPAFGKPDGDWQREFIAQRTAPLDAGRSMAELAETLVPQMIGPGSLPEGVCGSPPIAWAWCPRRPTGARSSASSPSTAAPTWATSWCPRWCWPASTTATRRRP